MVTKRAKTITEQDLERVYRIIESGEHPVANRLKMDLSFYAGLRVCEIARLSVDAFLNANGEVGEFLLIFGHVGKMGRERSIPIHPELRKSMEAFLEEYPDIDHIAVGRKPGPQSTGSLCTWFHQLYAKAGLKGCSSHSGRRTFITQLAQRVGHFNGSLRDVQDLAGHARLDTTQAYIEPSKNRASLVASLGSPEFKDGVPKRTQQRSETAPALKPRRRGRAPLSSHDLINRL